MVAESYSAVARLFDKQEAHNQRCMYRFVHLPSAPFYASVTRRSGESALKILFAYSRANILLFTLAEYKTCAFPLPHDLQLLLVTRAVHNVTCPVRRTAIVKTFGRAMINLGSMQIFVRTQLARVYFISAPPVKQTVMPMSQRFISCVKYFPDIYTVRFNSTRAFTPTCRKM